MPEGRPAIPAELRRRVLIEAGHRCAVPTCRQHPVEIEHIEDWAKVKEHRFENLIALCPNCHSRKGSGPNQIDRKSLRQYKANLAVLNSRYGDVERRLIEAFGTHLRQGGSPTDQMVLGAGSQVLVMYLIQDGYLEQMPFSSGVKIGGLPAVERYRFTRAGLELVERWQSAQPIDPEPDAVA